MLTALENGIDGETLGASLYELTLIPDFKLFANTWNGQRQDPEESWEAFAI